MREADFSLPVKERAIYGATITARSLDTGDTLTIARTGRTAVQAVREICELLDAQAGRYRVVSISTPVSIRRDIYANRVALTGDHSGAVDMPEKTFLARVGRVEMLHPSLDRASGRGSRPRPRA